jgi:hypothetical protein
MGFGSLTVVELAHTDGTRLPVGLSHGKTAEMAELVRTSSRIGVSGNQVTRVVIDFGGHPKK